MVKNVPVLLPSASSNSGDPGALFPYDIYKGKKSNTVKGDIRNILTLRPYRPYSCSSIPDHVLVEDDYIGILELIIQREFFPDLPLLLACEEAGKAKSNGSVPSRIKELEGKVRELQQKRKENSVPSVFRDVVLQDGRKICIDVSKLKLKEFLSLFTSEDNASFERLLHKEKLKLAARQIWMEKAAVVHNMDNLQLSEALRRGERPAQLLYGHTDARNPLMLSISSETAGIVGLFPDEKAGEFLALSLPQPVPTTTSSRGVVVATNTRLHNEDEFMDDMYEKQILKQECLDRTKADNILFDEMVEKGVYSANAIVDMHLLEALKNKGKRKDCLSSEDLKRIEMIKSGIKTPAHKGYSFLHTPLGENGTPHPSTTPAPTFEVPKFTIPELSVKELAAQRLCDKASRRIAVQKLRNKSNSIREVLRATGTPLTRINTPLSVFHKTSSSSVSLLRHARVRQKTSTLTCLVSTHPKTSSPMSAPPANVV